MINVLSDRLTGKPSSTWTRCDCGNSSLLLLLPYEPGLSDRTCLYAIQASGRNEASETRTCSLFRSNLGTDGRSLDKKKCVGYKLVLPPFNGVTTICKERSNLLVLSTEPGLSYRRSHCFSSGSQSRKNTLDISLSTERLEFTSKNNACILTFLLSFMAQCLPFAALAKCVQILLAKIHED
ncbi:hypothetical protein SCHPADRAFT_691129 [Schizopora paradoxa]|uniref:Uncharacterized protein n=1 Tax=Schizopora paradoxa TaxID=27342 RepID=A0A0H2R518_9AGAM|nr:hypothetical protein SCHPADRAFT_691129 [Schizopora paradoxa]